MEKKLLIIEDSKPIAKVHRHIAKRIGLAATIAYSYAQTKRVLEEAQDFFCAVIDYNLPDASNGEAIDYVVEAGIPVIVMTGITNQQTREAILKRSIIDYIAKDNKQAYVYLQQLLAQLLRNEFIKVLVVDDSETSRSFISNQLYRHNYQVLESVDGMDALRMLEEHPDIKLVLTDQEMPKMDGISLINRIRQSRSKEELVIIGISGSRNTALTARFIKNGANDYLHKPFCIEEFNCRLMSNIQYLENIETIRQQTTKVEQRNHDIAVLSEIGRQITATLDLEKILSQVYEHVNSMMDAYVFSIGLFDAKKEQIEFKLVIQGGERLPQFSMQMSEKKRLAVWCISRRQEIIINQVEDGYALTKSIPESLTDDDTQSLIYQPLLVQDRLIGCLSVQSKEKDAYKEHQLDMVRAIAASAAVALDNAQAHRNLQESQEQLLMQEKMASLGTLTAGVAHEINNPTNFAHVSTQNLEIDLENFKNFLFELVGEDGEQEVIDSFNRRFEPLFRHLSTIKEGTKRIKGIVKDLQAFTRHDMNGRKDVQIVESLESTIKLVEATYRESTDIETDFSVNPVIDCWPAQLNQVFMNLLVNACQAIMLKLKDQPNDVRGKVVVSTYMEDDRVAIAFTDDGVGMQSDTLSKLFEPFFTTKDVGEGTGLGLSISFGIIQKHEGEILVESTLGQGSTFTIMLPMTHSG